MLSLSNIVLVKTALYFGFVSDGNGGFLLFQSTHPAEVLERGYHFGKRGQGKAGRMEDLFLRSPYAVCCLYVFC